jgi:glycosyltransferase involved in cell wall biosynthesis
MTVSLYRYVRRADIVHVHYVNAWPSLVATMYCRIFNKPYVVQPHGGLEPYHMAKSSQVKALFELLSGTVKNADALVLATETEAARISMAPKSRKFVLPLGALPTACSSSPVTEGPEVLFLARLAPKKRLDVLLHAWVQVVREIPAARLHVVGPDTDGLLDGYRHLVASLSLERAVRFSGLLLGEEKQLAFAGAAIFALPSENESFGVAVAEALSAGLPVVVSENVAIADEVRAAGAGVVVPGLEPGEWAQELTALLRDGARRLAMSAAARRLASERFSWEKAALRLEQVYRALLDGSGLPQ